MTKWMEIDYDYLRTGTAIGFRASRELCSNYLCIYVDYVHVCCFVFMAVWVFAEFVFDCIIHFCKACAIDTGS